MRVWFVTVILLFLGVQLYQWLQGFMLPLPLYVMAGAFLAIASNYDKGMDSFLSGFKTMNHNEIIHQNATLINENKTLDAEKPKSESQEKN